MKLKIVNPNKEILMKTRALFTINGCYYCRMYLSFIERINSKLPINKRIEVINCTQYHDFGIVDNPKIPMFLNYYNGSYPTLFMDGMIIRGANSREELEAWIKGRLENEFVVPEDLNVYSGGEYYPLTFDKSCRFIKKGIFRRKISCQG